MDVKSVTVNVDLPLTYLRKFEATNKPLLILFHGFTDSAQAFLRRAYPVDDSPYEVLAINGLFPSPVKIEGGWKRAYSWYFGDSASNTVLISPDVAASAVQQLLEILNLQNRPKVLAGFSQGGFFLGPLSKTLSNIQMMIGIGAGYRFESFGDKPLKYPLHAIHGTEDDIVTFQHGQESFEKLKVKNPLGKFYPVQGLKHTMNDEAREIFRKLIEN